MWLEEGKKLIKVFEGDSPKGSGAVDFFKKKRSDGFTVELISRRHGFPPPIKQSLSPSPGLLWCPYCIKWREFEYATRTRRDFYTPELLRCPTCGISVKDYYVRKYNALFVERYEAEQELKRVKLTKVPKNGGRRKRR